MEIVSTIVPIFIVIFLGLLARQKGFISAEFLAQGNRLVYYIAIPAMIFNAIAKASLKTEMHPAVILITLASVAAVALIAWILARSPRIPGVSKGSFIQCAFHGNLGYIGLAVAFYYLGETGLVRAAIIAGFVMILQNVLAVVVLQYHRRQDGTPPDWPGTLKKTLANPVILSALAGILFSLLNLTLPVILDRALGILKGMALPTALIIIGASLSFEKLKPRFVNVVLASLIKVGAAPAIGLILFRIFSVMPADYLPGLIILAAPTATLAYILAGELGGDPDFAVAAISICTICSGATYGFWLGLG